MSPTRQPLERTTTRAMDLNRDELRRELRAIDADNLAAMPRWRAALRQIMDGGTSLSTDAKAAFLGVPAPGRRQLFKLGGASVLGAAVLAACGSDGGDEGGGGEEETEGDAAATPVQDEDKDLNLLLAAASIEQLAIDTYQKALDSGLVTTPAVGAAATLFQSHHMLHLESLNGSILDLKGEEVTEPNAAIAKEMVEPALLAATAEADIVKIAFDLEQAAAETYVFAGGELGTPALRSTIMTIGGIEARHAAVLRLVSPGAKPLDVFPPAEQGFFPGRDPIEET